MPSLQCLFQPLGEPVRPCSEMGVRSGVGGQVLPDRGPQAEGVGDSMHGVQGSRFLVLLQRLSPGGGSCTHGEDWLLHLVAFLRGKVGEQSQEHVGSVYGDGALQEFVCLGRRALAFPLWSPCVSVPSFWFVLDLCA